MKINNKNKPIYRIMKKTTKTVKTPKTPKAKKSTKKQQKPSFAEVLKEVLNMNLVQKESQESNKSPQDTPNDEDNKLYIKATPEAPDEPEIIIEVDLDPDPTFEVEVETLPDPNKIEAEIETPLITFKEEPKESPVLEASNKDEIKLLETEVKEEKPKEVKKPALTYKERLEAIKARLNHK